MCLCGSPEAAGPRAICLKSGCYLPITALSSSVCIRSTAELTAKTDTLSLLLLLFTKNPGSQTEPVGEPVLGYGPHI